MLLRVLLADNHPLVRSSLRVILESDPQIVVVDAVHDGEAAMQIAAQLRADVIVMDLQMPRGNGITATRQICSNDPAAKILILSLHDERSMVLAALDAGAAGYLLKNAAARELIPALYALASGGTYLSSSLVEQVRLARPQFLQPPASPCETPRPQDAPRWELGNAIPLRARLA